MSPLEGAAHQIAREARVAANCAQPGWAYSLDIPRRLFRGEMKHPDRICSYASVSTILGELVRIDIDLLDIEAGAHALKFLLRSELEPFIIGVGKVRAVETAKGIVIMRED